MTLPTVDPAPVPAKHTPGPWHVGAQNDMLYVIAGEPPAMSNDFPNHEANRIVVGSASTIANARLIAAAPEMLEALEEALELLMPHYDSDGFFHLTADGIDIDEGCEHCQLWARLSPLIHRLKGGAS